MGSTNFSKIKIGSRFQTKDGETYKKTSELTFDDSIGLEHYIGSELGFDAKIVVPAAAAEPKPAKKSKSKK